MASQNVPIDGERKYRVVADAPGTVRIVGLLRRSEWASVRKAELFTMRQIHGATLKVESLKGQLPPIGLVFPAALLTADGRTGKVMSTHLSTIAANDKAGREALKALKAIKAAIL